MENTIQQPNMSTVTQVAAPKPPKTEAPEAPSTQQVAADIERARNDASEVIAVSADEIRQAAESLRVNVKRVEPALKITIDDALDIPIVTVVDEASNKVIRQIPNEEVVELARFMHSQNFDNYGVGNDFRGIILNDKS